ncbi:MAG: hypothetical protein AAF514_22615, partial [Verrucomicrobiota bacterium]
GIRYADYFFDLNFQAIQRGQATASDLEGPLENEGFLAFLICTQSHSRILDKEQLVQAVSTFRKKRPQLAFMASLNIMNRPIEEAREIAGLGTDLIASINQPRLPVYMALTSFLSNPAFNQPDLAEDQKILTDAQYKIYRQKIVDWYTDTARQASPWTFTSVVGVLSQADNYEELFLFLDREIEAGQKQPAGPTGFNPYFGHRNQSNIVATLTFPPQQLPEFPGSVLSLLAQNPNGYGGQLRLDPEKIAASLDQLKSPALKTILTHRSGDEEATEKMIQEQLEGEEPSLQSHLLAAAYEGTFKDNIKKALEILQKASYLPMSQQTRKMVDGAMVGWSLAYLTEVPESEEEQIKKNARDAALRLRRIKVDPNQKAQLVTALETLGLEKEANKLLAVAPSNPNSRSGSVNPFTRNLGNQQSKIDTLLSKGKRQQAVKLLLNDLRGFASAGLSPQGVFQNQYQEREWMEKVVSNRLVEDLLKGADPGENASLRRRIEFAYARELFGETKDAISAYTTLLEQRPKDSGLRMRLARLTLLHGEEDGFFKIIQGLNDSDVLMLAQNLNQVFYDDSISFDKKLTLVEKMGAFAREKKKEKPAFNAGWLVNLADSLANLNYVEQTQIG